MSSLLEKAKQVSTNGRSYKVSPELIELAIAWAKDNVGSNQVKGALKLKTAGQIYSQMALALREAIRTGHLIQSKK